MPRNTWSASPEYTVRFIDPNGACETDGHFWTVHLMATMMGSKYAFNIAHHTERWDNRMYANGDAYTENPSWMDPTYQRAVHALTGGSSTYERMKSAIWWKMLKQH